MKYAVIKSVNGTFAIATEGHTTPEQAIISWHDVCKNHHNAQDVVRATILIVDENLDPLDGGKYKETIVHPAQTPAE